MSSPEKAAIQTDAVMADLQSRVRSRLCQELLRHGAPSALEDPLVYESVERVLRHAVSPISARALLLPELLGNPSSWRLDPSLAVSSHRGALAAMVVRALKQRVLMPAMRWLFEYTHDNFVRQVRVNHVLFACVQELAIQNAELRRDLDRSTSRVDTDSGRPGAV